jgi:hypothetical protein
MNWMRDVRRHLLVRSTLGRIALKIDVSGVVEVTGNGLNASFALLWRHGRLNPSYFSGNVNIIVRIIGGMFREGICW